MKKSILVTGSAGFIGFHTSKKLLERGDNVIGIDNFNDYYDTRLKADRNKILEKKSNFKLYMGDISTSWFMEKVFEENNIEKVCNLAAQAGVRYSIKNPFAYEKANNLGFLTILETMKEKKVKNIVFASSSSVYGGIKEVPFKETMNTNQPVSLYASTKMTNELYAHTYNHLFDIHTAGLRFFTVYGPWGRPDMAYFDFANSITNNKPIKVFNNGNQSRDFTYIDDIVDGVVSAIDKVQDFNYEIFNLGNSHPVSLLDFISTIENSLGKTAEKIFVPAQPGDVQQTYADITKAKSLLNYNPKTSLQEGIPKFVEWYKDYYKVK